MSKILKEAATNNAQQRRFLPIIQSAETKIKTLVLVAFLFQQNKLLLLGSILAIIKEVQHAIPEDIPNKKAYVDGLLSKSDQFIKKYYNQPNIAFIQTREELKAMGVENIINISNPRKMVEFIEKNKSWIEAKGSPNVVDYPKQLKEAIKRLAEDPMTVKEEGKKPIELWQKAELDTRYEHQMQQLQDLRVKGVEYAYLSSHVNCSKRCQAWQGSLVALNQHAPNPQKTVERNFKYDKRSFIVSKMDGKNVYSLPDIMDVTDSYGYHNNIYCGFNCRHRLIPYRSGEMPPKSYDKDEIAKQRNIEIQIRELERKIRLLKTEEHLYNRSGDKITAAKYRKEWKSLELYYKKFCETHGYAWQEYRIKI